MDEGKALFLQIAEEIESSILDGSLGEGERAPSTNELSSFYRVNPATAGKGINLLVDQGILIKRRGLGMYVADGARELVQAERRRQFVEGYLVPLISEARALDLSAERVIELIRERAADFTRSP